MTQYIGLAMNLGVMGYGIEEVAVSAIRKVDTKVKQIANELLIGHGSLYMISGLTGTLAALHRHEFVHLGALARPLRFASWGVFFVANVFALKKNIEIFEFAKTIEKDFPNQSKRLKISAVLGMINCVGYMIATACTAFPGTQMVAIVLCILSLSAGSIKFFYDFLVLN